MTVDKLIEIAKYSNLQKHLGYDNWEWTVKLLADIKNFNKHNGDFQTYYLEFDSFLAKFKVAKDPKQLSGTLYKFNYASANLFVAGCIQLNRKILGDAYKPRLIDLALLCLRIGVNNVNRKEIMEKVAIVYSINYKRLDATLGRLVGEDDYEKYYGAYNEAFKVSPKHAFLSEWIESANLNMQDHL